MESAIILSHREVVNELGQLEPWFERSEMSVQRKYREDAPTIGDADLLVVLGSPNSVATGFCGAPAAAEITMVGEWVRRGRPYLGICFGAQVLARAIGGSVQRMDAKYLSYTKMKLASDASPELDGAWAVWHEDAIAEANLTTVLATVPHACTVFTHGRAWGIQPHIEFTPEIVQRLGIQLNVERTLWEPLFYAMVDDEVGLAKRAELLLDSFWSSVN